MDFFRRPLHKSPQGSPSVVVGGLVGRHAGKRGSAKGDLRTYETMIEAEGAEGVVSRFLDNYVVGHAREEQTQAYDALTDAFNHCVALRRDPCRDRLRVVGAGGSPGYDRWMRYDDWLMSGDRSVVSRDRFARHDCLGGT